MESLHQHTAFLCGHFTIPTSQPSVDLTNYGWEQFHLPDGVRDIQKRYFYPEFVNFCYANSFGSACVRFIKLVNSPMEITIHGNTIQYEIKELTLYLMPFNIVMYSIHLELETSDLNDCTALLFSLRTIDFYSEIHQTFVEKAIQPIVEVYTLLKGKAPIHTTDIIENGNKLRIFQVVNSHDEKMRALPVEQKDLLLYQLATVSKITKPGVIDEFSASEAYFNKIIKQSKISVFQNWSGMALMDTFTIHAFDAENHLLNNWTDSYFRMIYIHAIYQKSYLFNLNMRFRIILKQPVSSWNSALQSLNLKKTAVGQLVDEYEDFEQKCCFHKISYNFLPLEIASAIDRGLNIREEMQQLYKIIEKENKRKEEAKDNTVNTLLFSLSLLTLFSAIWDINSMIDKMYPYNTYMNNEPQGYRIVALSLIVVVFFLLFLVYRRKKDN